MTIKAADLNALRQENERLKEALSFYADEDKYQIWQSIVGMVFDTGDDETRCEPFKIAQNALNEKLTKKET